MKIALIVLALLVVVGVSLWLEGRPEKPEDLRQPSGPSTVIRGIRQRAKEQERQAQAERVRALEDVLRADAGAVPTSP